MAVGCYFVFRKREFEIPLRLGVAAAPPVEVLITEVGHLLLGPRVGVRRQLFVHFLQVFKSLFIQFKTGCPGQTTDGEIFWKLRPMGYQ